MAKAIGRESFFWHKLHSLSGIVPVGFYMVQHLTLNSFSLVSPAKYDAVATFFYSMPEHVLLGIEVLMVWLPLAFHMVYGLFISSRAQNNYFSTPFKWSQNRMFMLQRVTGVFLMVFLLFHAATTTLQVKLHGNDPSVVNYAAMQAQFTGFGYAVFAFYVLGILAASYHLAYGVWNFCIRWGITVGDRAQMRIQKFSFALFVGLTLLGWAALGGFLRHREQPSMQVNLPSTTASTSL